MKITETEFNRVLTESFNQGCKLTRQQKQNCQNRLVTDLDREDLGKTDLIELNTVNMRDDDIEHYISCEFEVAYEIENPY